MKRIEISPRDNYKKKIENLGFDFHDDYWTENAYYSFTKQEIENIHKASEECFTMACDTIEELINDYTFGNKDAFASFGLPNELVEKAIDSWVNDDLSLYGRFDFCINGDSIKLLEFNADTPTTLFESSVIQWDWKKDLFPDKDQYNSIHEELVDSLRYIKKEYKLNSMHFAGCLDIHEENTTLEYLASCARDAGLNTTVFDIENMSMEDYVYKDPSNRYIETLFKLYPIEWMAEQDLDSLVNSKTYMIEPLWKVFMSSKQLMVEMYKLFPESPYLLKSHNIENIDSNGDFMKNCCIKPKYGRQGDGVKLIKDGKVIHNNIQEEQQPNILQELCLLPEFDGKKPMVGSWIIGGAPCGIGIRESDFFVTDDSSKFIPHVIEND